MSNLWRPSEIEGVAAVLQGAEDGCLTHRRAASWFTEQGG